MTLNNNHHQLMPLVAILMSEPGKLNELALHFKQYIRHYVQDQKKKKNLPTYPHVQTMGRGSGTFRAKTSSSRDGSRKNYFSNGTFPPGTVRAFFQKLISRFYLSKVIN